MINQILYRGDIGLIGALNKFGIVYVLVALLILLKVAFSRKKIIAPPYIRLLFIFFLLTSVTGVNYFETTENIPLFVFVLYITEKASEEPFHNYTNP